MYQTAGQSSTDRRLVIKCQMSLLSRNYEMGMLLICLQHSDGLTKDDEMIIRYLKQQLRIHNW